MDAQRVDANSQHPAASPVLITDRQAAIFQLKMFAGRPGKANLSLKAALLNAPEFDVVTHRAHFEKLFPKRDSVVPLPVPPYLPVVNIEDEQVMASLKSSANGASADLFGFTGDALHLVSSQPAHIKHLTKLVTHIANNKLDDEVADVFRATKLIALPKKEFVPRPLGNCCVFPKLAADILMNRVKGEVKSICIVGDLQRAVGTPDGVASTIHNSQLLLEYLPQDAGLRAAFPNEPIVLAMTDEANAFNSVDISKCLAALFSYPSLDPLWPLALFLYGRVTDMLVHGFGNCKYQYIIKRGTGPTQGCKVAQLLYCLACLRFLCEAMSISKWVHIIAFADNVQLIGPLSEVIRVINWMVANSKSRTGGTLVPEKTLFLLPNGCQAMAPKLNHLIPPAKQAEQIFYGSMPCLGSMVGTDDLKKRAFVDDKVKELCVRMDQMHHELISGQNAVVNAHLCLVPSLNFLARTLPPHIVGPAAEKLYKHLSDGICLKLGLPPMRLMSAYAKDVFPLTTAHGGTGILNLNHYVDCCYVASLAETMKQMVIYTESRPGPASPELQWPVPQSVPLWPKILQAHAIRPPESSPRCTTAATLDLVLRNLVARGAVDYFAQHLRRGFPVLPGTLVKFVDYFSMAETPISKLQKHFSTYSSKKKFEEVFQRHGSDESLRARLLTNSSPGASLAWTVLPNSDRLVMSDGAMRYKLSQLLNVSPVAVSQNIASLQCAKCHKSLLDDPSHPPNCDMPERTTMHDMVKHGLRANAMDCGLAADVEPTKLHPEDNKRRVDLVVHLPEGSKLVDVSIVDPLCATHVRASAKEKQGFVLRKEREKIKHHHDTAERFEMEIVPFIVDLHGSHGPDARKFLRLLADFRPRPRLSGEDPKARVYEEMAASCVLIARKGAEVCRLSCFSKVNIHT